MNRLQTRAQTGNKKRTTYLDCTSGLINSMVLLVRYSVESYSCNGTTTLDGLLFLDGRPGRSSNAFAHPSVKISTRQCVARVKRVTRGLQLKYIDLLTIQSIHTTGGCIFRLQWLSSLLQDSFGDGGNLQTSERSRFIQMAPVQMRHM